MDMIKIGPAFFSELQAAGVQDWRFSWSAEDGVITFADDVANDQRALVQSAYAAHDPTKPAPPPIPQSVTRYQARAALDEAGLLQQVADHFAALPDDDRGKLAWLEAPTVERASPWLIDAAHALGLSDELIDQLFIAADQVR